MIGSTLSHYRIDAELGRGGMGIVYRAQDTKLNREVALKVLPSAALATDEDRARFYREAQAAAQLHHPNIATIFEIDEAVPSDAPHGTQPSPFIAMEFIEGETLEGRIKAGPMKLDEVVRIATEIASALEAAHEKDIVHRDIKSANVMLTKKGVAKVLDFGLAKTAQSTQLTRMGSTLGTVAYMSPEQARGEEVDGRTDIWALGVVLYETIAGRNPFGGDYEQAVVYGILNETPQALTAIRTGVPMGLEWIVNKCLAKQADVRYQSVSELIVDLTNVDAASLLLSRSVSAASVNVSTSGLPVVEEVAAVSRSPYARWGLGALVGLMLLAIGWFFGNSGTEESPAPFAKLPLHFEGISDIRHPVMSPNRDFIAFSGVSGSTEGVYLYSLATAKIELIEGTEHHRDQDFSPDGRRLVTNSRSGIWVTPIPGGLPDLWSEEGINARWINNESLAVEHDGDIYRLDGRDEELYLIVRTDSLQGADEFIYIGDVLFGQDKSLASYQFASNENANLVVVDFNQGTHDLLEPGAINSWYVKGGYVVYQLGTDVGRIMVRAFDREKTEWMGRGATPLLPETDWTKVRVTPQGDLLYVPASQDSSKRRLEWLSSTGEREIIKILGESYWFGMELSNDGSSVIINRAPSRTLWDVELVNVDLSSMEEAILSDDSGMLAGTWAPDDRSIFRTTTSIFNPRIVRQPIGSQEVSQVLSYTAADPHLSRDGKWLVYARKLARGRGDIVARNLESDDSLVVAASSGDERSPRISPNSDWVIYLASQGQADELKISRSDGSSSDVIANDVSLPRWSNDGQTVYYLKNGDLYAQAVGTEPAFRRIGNSVQMTFDGLIEGFSIDHSSDRILLLSDDMPPPSYSVLEWWQNWSAELQRTIPRSN